VQGLKADLVEVGAEAGEALVYPASHAFCGEVEALLVYRPHLVYDNAVTRDGGGSRRAPTPKPCRALVPAPDGGRKAQLTLLKKPFLVSVGKSTDTICRIEK
jgi:hypothetical protein